MARGRDRHGHPADRIPRLGRRGQRAPTRAGVPGGRRRRATISARMLTAISSGVTAPRSRPAGAFRRPRRVRPGSPARGATPRPPGRASGWRRGSRSPPSLRSARSSASSSNRPWVATTIAVRGVTGPRRGRPPRALREPGGRAARAPRPSPRSRAATPRPRERLDDRPAAHQDERGLRQDRLDEDLERPAAVTASSRTPGRRPAARATRRPGPTSDQEPGLAVLERAQRLLDAPRGSAQLPPIQPDTVPSCRISAFAPGLAEVGRSQRTTVATREGLAPPRELGGLGRASPARSRETGQPVYSVTPWSRRSFHTLAGVIGMSTWRTPEMPERVHDRVGDRRRARRPSPTPRRPWRPADDAATA